MARKSSGRKRPSTFGPGSARRSCVVGFTATIAILAFAAWWWLREPGYTLDADPNRNVLLITIDTLRADVLGSYGGRALTPNLDRLAASGARFDFAHAHAVVTLPSHASILTGRYPYEHGIRDNTGYRLSPAQPTAATLLKAQGFATGAFIGGFPLDRRFGLGVGFDVYDDRLSPAASAAEGSERERRADAVVKSTLDWIGHQSGKWFAWVHLYDPHVVYDPPGEWAARFPAEPYLGEVSWTDFALGALFDRLTAQARPTLIVVTADHGESLGEHGELTHGVFAYESALRVPLIVGEIDPGGESTVAGVTIEGPARHVDIMPTLLEAAGAPDDGSFSGTSLCDVIATRRGTDRPSYFEAMTATLTRGWAPLRGILIGPEKFIELPIPEMYDLSTDPKELRNIIGARTDRASVLLNMLRSFSVSAPARPQKETTDTIERLRSLGYIGGGAAGSRETYTDADDPKRLIELEHTMTRAAEVHRQGRLDEAVEMYESVIARRPDTEDAYRKLALVHWRAGRPRHAIDTLETALRNGVTQAEVRIKLGQYLAQAGRPGRAIELLESFAGDDPDALIALGNAYQMAGRSRDALRTFKHLLDVDPANGLAHENIGIAQLQAKDYAGAERSLRRALEADSNLAGAYTALGVVLASTNRGAEAIEAWKHAIALDATEFDALFNLTVNLAAAGRHDEARAYGKKYLATAPPALRNDIAAIRKLLAGV